MELMHTSPDANLTAITSRGIFGGIFACPGRFVGGHGDHEYIITASRVLTDFEMNYGEEAGTIFDYAVASFGADDAAAALDIDHSCDDCDDQFEIQRLRGLIAAQFGYDAVEMHDENGTSYLCLSGCAVRAA